MPTGAGGLRVKGRAALDEKAADTAPGKDRLPPALYKAASDEISRVLCDARILNIFEGAAEIQAQVIGRGLLARKN